METGDKQEQNRKPGTFKPGQSGNPKGRPPKGYSITEAFREMLAAEPDVKAQIVASIKEKAVKGDTTAQKLIWNYMDGMPTQAVELTGEEGGPVEHEMTIKFVRADAAE